MPPKKQIVLIKPVDPAARNTAAGLKPLGSLRQVREALSNFNTAPDGGKARMGTEIMHGPGIVVEVATGQDEISQAMVTVLDEEIAWPVLSRICKSLGWKMMDIESGRMYG
ncbi:MAG: hypothetical protein IT436_01630 [Phycisphaerales bacterium]|nr:hypothetical protein [Phycisphaerales bacterium]